MGQILAILASLGCGTCSQLPNYIEAFKLWERERIKKQLMQECFGPSAQADMPIWPVLILRTAQILVHF